MDEAIPWPLSSAPGASPQESGGRLINCSAEPLGDANAAKQVWRRRPGLSMFANLGATPFRGGILVGTLAFIAVGSEIVTVDGAGHVNVCGALPGAGPVTFARDNESPTPSIQCVVPGFGAYSVTTSSVVAFNGGGILPTPNSCCNQDAYIFWSIGDNRIFAAGPNSVATLNALTFTTIQSRPAGNLLRVVPYQGLLHCFTSISLEQWADTAQPFPGFPYSRYNVLDRGLLAANAIAGWEDGFAALHWVGNDCGVYRLTGGAPQKVSSPDLDRLIQKINAAGQASTLYAFAYIIDGKSFWVLSSPTWSWEINLNTDKWNERWSLNGGIQSGPWRASGSVNAFGQWLVGDLQSQSLLYLDRTNAQEVSTPMLMRMESGPVLKFPNRTRIARSDFFFVTGVGESAGASENAVNPQCMIACSRDGGVTWDNPRLRYLGQAANSILRVFGLNWGQSSNMGARWRLDISDPCYAAFTAATMSDDARAK